MSPRKLFGSGCVRFAQAGAVILTAALLAISNQQAHAVPDFRDGWVDQGGKWHPFVPNNGGGQPLGGPNGDGGTAGVGGSAGAGDSGGTTSTGLGLNTIFNDLP